VSPYTFEQQGRIYYTDPSGVTDLGIAASAGLTRLDVPIQGTGDHVHPNAFQRVKDDYYVDPFSFQLIDKTFGTQTFHGLARSGVTSGTSGLVETLPGFAPTVSVAAYEKAYAKLVGKIHEGGSQLVVDGAEWPETKALVTGSGALHKRVASTFETLHMYAKKHKRRDEVLIEKIRDQWLEYRYGIMPLMGSVYEALDNLHHRVVNQAIPIKVRAAVTDRWEASDTIVKWYSPAGPLSVPRYRNWEDSHRCEIGMFMTVPGAGIWDWTSLNPSVIAWELLPLSFVADWFVTVGQSLENLETYFMWKCGFQYGYVSYSYMGRRYARFGGASSLGNYGLICNASEARIRTALDRQVLGAFPVPTAPRFRLNLNKNRVIDAAALMHVFIGNKLRAFDKLANKAVRF